MGLLPDGTRTLLPSETDNLVRWTGKTSNVGHVESFFLKWNLTAETETRGDLPHRAFWLKFTIFQPAENRGPVLGEVWAIGFDPASEEHIAIKESFGQEQWLVEKDIFYLRFGNSELRHGASNGSISDGKHSIRWNIHWTTRTHGVRHLPFQWMYKKPFPKNKLTTPQPDGKFGGYIEIDGQRLDFDHAPGMQGHNWGTSHAPVWVWTHSNILEGNGRAVFEGVSSRVKIGPLRSGWVTIVYLEYDGEPILLNSPTQLIRNRSVLDGLSWSFEVGNKEHRIVGHFEGQPDWFVGVNYHNPDGSLVHCLNTKMASGQIEYYRKGDSGLQLVDTLVTTRGAALEIGTRDNPAGVPIQIL